MQKFDIVVIGAGISGFSAAMRGAERGARVCLVERMNLGGNCVYKGLYSLISMRLSLESLCKDHQGNLKPGLAIESNGYKDLVQLRLHAGEVAKEVTEKMHQELKNAGVDIQIGSGDILSPNQVGIRRGKESLTTQADKIIYSVGSTPQAPANLPFQEDAIISLEQIFELHEVPGSILIFGTDWLGWETASFFNRLGCKVFLGDDNPILYSKLDPEIASVFDAEMKRNKIKLLLNKRIVSHHNKKDKIHITLDGDVRFSVEKILLAGPRKGNISGLDADRLGIRLGSNNKILVNERQETSTQGIFAVGSVTGRSYSLNLSEEEGRVAADNALGRERALNPDWIPHTVYTEPEFASVGCRLQDASQKGFHGVEGRCDASQLDRSLLYGDTSALFKVVADRSSKRVIGAQIVSHRASEIIPLVLLAIKKGLTVNALASLACGISTESRGIREAAKACDKALKSRQKASLGE